MDVKRCGATLQGTVVASIVKNCSAAD